MAHKYDLGLLLLRISFGGLMMIEHGWPKFEKVLHGNLEAFGDPLGLGAPASLILAAFSEFICAALVILGLFTRWASVFLIATMLVAVFIVHWPDPLGDKELGLLYLVPFVLIWIWGPGMYSIDERWLHRF